MKNNTLLANVPVDLLYQALETEKGGVQIYSTALRCAIKTRKVAFLIADGFDDAAVSSMKQALLTAGAAVMTVAPKLGMLTGANGEEVKADLSFLTGSSVLFDAVYVPGGEASVASLKQEREAGNFLNEAYKHCKTIAASSEGVALLQSAGVLPPPRDEGAKSGPGNSQQGIITSRDAAGNLSVKFIQSIAQHRHWERELTA